MVITEHGRAAAVLLDVGTYKALTRRASVLEGIELGGSDFAEGNTASWEDVQAAHSGFCSFSEPPEAQGDLQTGRSLYRYEAIQIHSRCSGLQSKCRWFSER